MLHVLRAFVVSAKCTDTLEFGCRNSDSDSPLRSWDRRAAGGFITMLHVLAAFAPHAFYLPGVAPKEYQEGDAVQVKVNKLSSAVTQLPFDYYRLPHCRPAELVNMVENLGEVLHGSMIQNSAYELQMGKSDFKVLCKKDLTKREAMQFALRIRQDYRVHMIMDNLPAATRMISELPDGKTVTMYDRGYRLGFVGAKEFPGTKLKQPYINNHLRFIVKYHKEPATFTGARIVGFEVEAFSVKHTYKGTWGTKDAKLTSVPLSPDLPPQPISEAGEYIFTYDVSWEEPDIKWASRWDLYLYMGDDQIHWFSILNSLAIVLLLTGIVAMIMMRTLRRDLNRYNQEEKEELQEESGWKLVHADVLRPPPLPLLLCASIGTGMQVRRRARRTHASSSGAEPHAFSPHRRPLRCGRSLGWRRSPLAARCSASSHPPTAAGC